MSRPQCGLGVLVGLGVADGVPDGVDVGVPEPTGTGWVAVAVDEGVAGAVGEARIAVK